MGHLLTGNEEEQETDELTSSDDSDDDFGKFVLFLCISWLNWEPFCLCF